MVRFFPRWTNAALKAGLAGYFAAFSCLAGCASVPKPEPPPAAAPPQSSENSVVVNLPEKKCCSYSIWDFLGVKETFKVLAFLTRGVRSFLGQYFPGLEGKPPLLPIAAAENKDSPYPSVKAAAEAKAEEDAAAQKIKGINYLATLGCSGCYPDVEAALLASLDDCNEGVRYAAVKALRGTSGNPCQTCKAKACCSDAIIKRLYKLANDTDGEGCFVESSARVRRVARLTMRGCGKNTPIAEEEEPPIEGPTPADAEGPAGDGGAPGGEQTAATGNSGDAGSTGAIASVLKKPLRQRNSDSSSEPPTSSATTSSPTTSSPTTSSPPSSPMRLPSKDGVVARVNGLPIFEQEIATRVERSFPDIPRGRIEGNTAARRKRLRLAAAQKEIQEVVNRKLLCQEARRWGFHADVARASYQTDNGNVAGDDLSESEESGLAAAWLAEQVRVDDQVSQQELWRLYQQDRDRFQTPPQVRWEMIFVPTKPFDSRAEARRVVSFWRNRAMGIADNDVPENAMQVRARKIDWTPRDQTPSAQIGRMLFSMRPGSLSPVLEEPDRFVVVRLRERREGRSVPFETAAATMRNDIFSTRRKQAEATYVESLRRRADIWTIFD